MKYDQPPAPNNRAVSGVFREIVSETMQKKKITIFKEYRSVQDMSGTNCGCQQLWRQQIRKQQLKLMRQITNGASSYPIL